MDYFAKYFTPLTLPVRETLSNQYGTAIIKLARREASALSLQFTSKAAEYGRVNLTNSHAGATSIRVAVIGRYDA